MQTKQVTPQQLNSLERMVIALHCKSNPEFIAVRHDHETIYFNGNHPAAAQLESLFLDILTADLLDTPTASGAIPLDILETVERMTNADAASMLCSIWREEHNKRRKAQNKAKAIAWRADNRPAPDWDLPGMDTDFLRAVWFTVKEQEQKAPAQEWNREHAFNEALNALFYYGYQCGTGAAK